MNSNVLNTIEKIRPLILLHAKESLWGDVEKANRSYQAYTLTKGMGTVQDVAYTSGSQKSETDHTGKVTSYVYGGLGRLTQEAETSDLTVNYT